MTPTFHVFYPKTWREGYYLDYDGEVTMEEIIDAILHDPVRPKMECPGVVLNKFKEVESRYGYTVRNKYDNLLRTTGYFALDVDKCGAKVNLIKRTIFELPEVVVSWVSSSGNGVKAVGYNPKLADLTPRMFTMYYRVMTTEMRIRCGMRINFDQAMARCHQPVFVNSDTKALYKNL